RLSRPSLQPRFARRSSATRSSRGRCFNTSSRRWTRRAMSAGLRTRARKPHGNALEFSPMDRVYRVLRGETPAYVVEREGAVFEMSGDVFGKYEVGAQIARGLDGATLLAPVRPSKIVCVGLNYKDHAAETGKPLPAEPLIFIKPTSAVIGPGE